MRPAPTDRDYTRLSHSGAGASVRRAVMLIRLEPEGKRIELPGRRRVGDLLTKLGIVAGTVLVIREDELLTEDEVVEEGDDIELRAVISGGAS